MSNTTSRFFSFSDEFKEWAKQEDAVNNQMNSNWIPAYIIITLIPIGFIISAALASRKETKRQASERAARAARIGELLPLWLRNIVFTTRRANSDSQAATGTDENVIGLRDVETRLAKTSTRTTTITEPGPTHSRDSIASDTGAVIAGGATHGTDDASPARRQLRNPVGEQFRQHWQRHAQPGASSARSRPRGRTIWPSYLE